MKTIPAWQKIAWPYNNAEPYRSWQCFARKAGRGRIILHPGQWPGEGWCYVASFGADSDRSHSGFLPGFVSLDSAQAEIERRISAGAFA